MSRVSTWYTRSPPRVHTPHPLLGGHMPTPSLSPEYVVAMKTEKELSTIAMVLEGYF